MPINNVKVTLNGVDLQVNPNGVTAHKIQIVDDFMPWLSRAAITALREDDDSIGFDVTMITGKRVRVYYGASAAPTPPMNNNSSVSQLYRKVIQTSFDISGVGMTLAEAAGIFAVYKEHQKLWGKRAQLLAQIQDPDISSSTKQSLIDTLTGLVWTPITLSLMGSSYQVIFGDGMTCQFINWVVGNYTDFTFNLVQREPLT